MEPHREAIGGRDVEDAVEDEVRWIERGDVALGDERDAQPEPLAPERQPAVLECAGQLALERAIHPVRVAADRLVTDQQPAQDRTDEDEGQDQRSFAPKGLWKHEVLTTPMEIRPESWRRSQAASIWGVRLR